MTYLIVAMVTLAVVGLSLYNEPTIEIVGGLTDIPGLDRSATTSASQSESWFGSGFIGFVRLMPVPDQLEPHTETPSEVYSFGRGNQERPALPKFYSPVFSEEDLMSRVHRYGGIVYYRFCNRYGVYITFKDEV